MGIELNQGQIYCIMDLEHWWNSRDKQLFEINGRGGTGKTTMIKYFIERIGLSLDEVAFITFMGKAASILAKNGLPGKTIHSTIYKYKMEYARDEKGKIIFKSNGKPKLQPVFIKRDHLNKKIKLIVVDEGSMVEAKIALDILSFNLPTIVLGDLNQLPPPFGNSFFLQHPDYTLTEIMRQKEGDPIIHICEQILHKQRLKPGVYGRSAIIRRSDMDDYYFKHSSVVLTGTNRLRYNVNKYCREEILHLDHLELPHYKEKVVCRKNTWAKCVDGIYLTNGLTGFIDHVYKDSFNGKTMKIDFRPDFLKKSFHAIEFDYKHMYEVPGTEDDKNSIGYYYDKMEFAYALTVHSSQGSTYDSVLYLREPFMKSEFEQMQCDYTAASRATDSLVIVLDD